MEVTYSDLIMGKRIGQGACSCVNMAKHSETGEMFAVKMFNVYDEVNDYKYSHVCSANFDNCNLIQRNLSRPSKFILSSIMTMASRVNLGS